MSFDVGTSALKGILVDMNGKIISSATGHYDLSFPRDGLVEFDPEDHWKAICSASEAMIHESRVDVNLIRGISFITQSQNMIPMDPEGNVIRPAISWLDGRSDKEADDIVELVGGEEACKKISGARYTGFDILPKVKWLADNEPENFNKMRWFVDCNGYLTYKATGTVVYDISSASITGYDDEHGKINEGFLEASGFDPEKFPPIVHSYDLIGHLTSKAAEELGLTEETEVFGGTFDVLGAALGTGTVEENAAHIYMGTSGWTGIISSKKDMLTHGGLMLISADPKLYLRCYSQATCCANFEWFLDTFFTSERAEKPSGDFYEYVNSCADSVATGAGGIIFHPWLTGERSPVPNVNIRGGFLNLGINSTRNEMLRAVMEGIAYNIKWSYDSMEDDLGYKTGHIRIMGGATNSSVWMQMFADLFGRPVEVIEDSQNAGALGGAFIAALGLGKFEDFRAMKEWVKINRVYHPDQTKKDAYDIGYKKFKESYDAVEGIYDNWNGHQDCQ